ncbi:MAG: LysM peptidoglycan-binding domain-containing M23 family metallopeptidase [Rhodobacteraceae bacterium]|nr:LysM peptidoglycan-binding domain-containing M23 family metallopeptidase [Paracoccaceae bacterium]
MRDIRRTTALRAVLAGTALLALAGCEDFDYDFRDAGRSGLNTSDAAAQATQPKPVPDSRGVISYPSFKAVVARRGDTVETVAARVGVSPQALATANAIPPGTKLREGEVLTLPGGAPAGGPPPIGSLPTPGAGGTIDVTSIASGAIDRAEAGGATAAPGAGGIGQTEPIRHRVMRGETAYTIARLYNVDVRALADWNGLGADLSVREGQTLLIPMAAGRPPAAPTAVTTAPGVGSPTPLPPSSTTPLPDEATTPAAKPVATPPAPDLGGQTAASAPKLGMPVAGKIIKGYQKGKNDGIDIAAAAGTPVAAAADGVVAAITKDTDQVPILVVRHPNNLLTVYANIDGIAVQKGAKVKRGQQIAVVRSGASPYLHFEVRQGFDSVDPLPYLQ